MAALKNAQPAPVKVTALRTLLDAADIPWREVRDYPEATYLPESYHTIWWQSGEGYFKWGANFQHRDEGPETVLAKLKEELADGTR